MSGDGIAQEPERVGVERVTSIEPLVRVDTAPEKPSEDVGASTLRRSSTGQPQSESLFSENPGARRRSSDVSKASVSLFSNVSGLEPVDSVFAKPGLPVSELGKQGSRPALSKTTSAESPDISRETPGPAKTGVPPLVQRTSETESEAMIPDTDPELLEKFTQGRKKFSKSPGLIGKSADIAVVEPASRVDAVQAKKQPEPSKVAPTTQQKLTPEDGHLDKDETRYVAQ